MTDHSLGLRLNRIIGSIAIGRDEVAGTTLDAFGSDRRQQLIVKRCSEIISEASWHVPAEMKVAFLTSRGRVWPASEM